MKLLLNPVDLGHSSYAGGKSMAAEEHLKRQAGVLADMVITSETCYALWREHGMITK